MTTYTLTATGPTYTLLVDGAPTPITASHEDWLLIAGAIEAGGDRRAGDLRLFGEWLFWSANGSSGGRLMSPDESLALAASIREATADTPPRALDRDRGAPGRLTVEGVEAPVTGTACWGVIEDGVVRAVCYRREMAERIVEALERAAAPAELTIGVALCDPRVRRGQLIVERGRPRTNTVEQMGWFPVGRDMEFRRRRRHGDEPWEPWKVEERGVPPGILDCLCRLVEPEEGTHGVEPGDVVAAGDRALGGGR